MGDDAGGLCALCWGGKSALDVLLVCGLFGLLRAAEPVLIARRGLLLILQNGWGVWDIIKAFGKCELVIGTHCELGRGGGGGCGLGLETE